MKKLPSVSLSAFAKLCGVTVQTVSNWKSEGMPCIGGGRQGVRVQVDIAKALPWVIARRDSRPDSQRERLAREQADKVAIENAQRRGEVVSIGVVGGVLRDLAATLSQHLEAIPNRCASEFAGTADVETIRARLRQEVRAVRAAMGSITGKLADQIERVASEQQPHDGRRPAI